MEISFECTPEERRLLHKIVDRAMHMQPRLDRMETEMDVLATHANGNPLKLAELLAADDFNFAHDVFGIKRHINRETAQLENCFVPRYAK